jgi:hypothetical protein
MPFQRFHTAADAAFRAEVGDGQTPVFCAQHLLAVVDGAVNQPTRCIVVDPRIAIVEHAQLAVEVASDHFISVRHLEHDAAEDVRRRTRIDEVRLLVFFIRYEYSA